MHALADQIALIDSAYFKFHMPTIDFNHFGCGRHAHTHRRGREMGDIEMCTQALMPDRQQMLNGGKRSGFEQIDHHRCREYVHTTGADKWRGVFITNSD